MGSDLKGFLSSPLLDRLPSDARAAAASLAEEPTVALAQAAFGVFRSHGDEDSLEGLAEALAATRPDVFIAVVLPGARFDQALDVRTTRPLKFIPGWCGDLAVEWAGHAGGVAVTVGSKRGADALVALDSDVRGAIALLAIYGDARSAEILSCVASVTYPGVRSLALDDFPLDVATALLKRCPAVEKCSSLSQARALTELSIGGRSLDDSGVTAIGGLQRVERLFLGDHRIADGTAALALSSLIALRALDLHGTEVGDRTATALSRLPLLAELDLTDTKVTAVGVRALLGAPALERLGLAWNAPPDISEVAGQFPPGVVEWSDYDTGAGLWGGGYVGS